MHRKSVGLVLHSFSQGGTDRVAALLSKGFAERDYATELFIFARGGQAEAALMSILPANVKLTFLGSSSGSRAWDLVRLFPAFVRALRRARPGPDFDGQQYEPDHLSGPLCRRPEAERGCP